jgi:hypothetical protein
MAAPFLPLWQRAQNQDTLPPPRRQRFSNGGFLVVDDDYEPMDVERPPPPPPMPPHLSLAGLPPRVIAVMVQQAALTARESATPANEICVWMRDFCRSATNAELQCDDNLFRLALGTFGEVPEKAPGRVVFPDPMTPEQRAARGEEYTGKVDGLDNVVPVPAANAPPAWSGFSTWRSLFGALCDAAHHNWRDQERSSLFWKLGTGNREVVAHSPTQDLRMAAKLYKPNQSQRDLDLLLDALLYRQSRHYGQDSGVEELKSAVAQWLGGAPKTAAWMSEESWWMALVTWAILRGARPFQAEAHKQADRNLYSAMSGLTWLSQGADVNVAARRIKTALEAGADPNLYEDTIRTLVGILPPNKPADWNRAFPNGGYPPVFLLALQVGHPEIIRLLVEGGASRTAISGSGFQPNNARFFQVMMTYLRRQQPQSDRPTTEKLLGMLGDYFFWRSTRANHGAERSVFQREADLFQELIRGWTGINTQGPLAATVPGWFFAALRKAAARTPEGRRARVRARE